MDEKKKEDLFREWVSQLTDKERAMIAEMSPGHAYFEGALGMWHDRRAALAAANARADALAARLAEVDGEHPA